MDNDYRKLIHASVFSFGSLDGFSSALSVMSAGAATLTTRHEKQHLARYTLNDCFGAPWSLGTGRRTHSRALPHV